MKCQSLYVLLTALLLAAPERGTAQTTTEITVRVPVILTQLAPDVKAVRVNCNLISNELLNATNGNQLMKSGEDITVSGGEVVKVVTIVLTPVLQNPAGKTAGLGCWIEGWSASENKFYNFTEDATNPAFRTKPSLTAIQTTWVW